MANVELVFHHTGLGGAGAHCFDLLVRVPLVADDSYDAIPARDGLSGLSPIPSNHPGNPADPNISRQAQIEVAAHLCVGRHHAIDVALFLLKEIGRLAQEGEDLVQIVDVSRETVNSALAGKARTTSFWMNSHAV